MNAVVITKHGPPKVMQVQEQPDPSLGPDEVRIEVAASGVNFADVMARVGLYADAPKPPMVVGYEVAGTVLEVGPDVSGLTPGQRVLAGTKFGGYASQVACAQSTSCRFQTSSHSSRVRRSPSTTPPRGPR